MRYVYLVDIRPVEGTWLVTSQDIPMVATEGATLEEAVANAADGIGVALRYLAKHGRPIPRPSAGPGPDRYEVAVPLDDALKVAVIEAFATSNITKTELARRIDRVESEARRILDPDHPTKLPMLDAALAALGRQAVLEVAEPA